MYGYDLYSGQRIPTGQEPSAQTEPSIKRPSGQREQPMLAERLPIRVTILDQPPAKATPTAHETARSTWSETFTTVVSAAAPSVLAGVVLYYLTRERQA